MERDGFHNAKRVDHQHVFAGTPGPRGHCFSVTMPVDGQSNARWTGLRCPQVHHSGDVIVYAPGMKSTLKKTTVWMKVRYDEINGLKVMKVEAQSSKPIGFGWECAATERIISFDLEVDGALWADEIQTGLTMTIERDTQVNAAPIKASLKGLMEDLQS